MDMTSSSSFRPANLRSAKLGIETLGLPVRMVLTQLSEQVVLCAEGEPRMPVLAAPGHVRFFMDGAEVSLPEERWTLADHGENWLLFAAGSEDAGARVLLRYAWPGWTTSGWCWTSPQRAPGRTG